MGFVSWLMKSNKVSNKQSDKNSDRYQNFNLHEKYGDTNESVASPNFDSININNSTNIIIYEPKSHEDIQKIIDNLRKGQSAHINLAGISKNDCNRILDFLSGAIYGLNGSIYRISTDQFLISPEGSKIMKLK